MEQTSGYLPFNVTPERLMDKAPDLFVDYEEEK